ncbi:hypothetical protein [Luteibacter yeojuensis]|uniref:Uncharacterized protein n=1 Tax=Luteibacter yeojuensis TaxID=345309 RepID=A0A7X5TPA4_9GAMM|nr:hypothetical protein [Luteibacter yeojuensis]NID14509.1 hypothetical protein [Luteibacter yeojuensis]
MAHAGGGCSTACRRPGFAKLFLLTTTATDYFVERGYRRVDREEVPADIRSTRQFAGLCPASALVMVKELEV